MRWRQVLYLLSAVAISALPWPLYPFSIFPAARAFALGLRDLAIDGSTLGWRSYGEAQLLERIAGAAFAGTGFSLALITSLVEATPMIDARLGIPLTVAVGATSIISLDRGVSARRRWASAPPARARIDALPPAQRPKQHRARSLVWLGSACVGLLAGLLGAIVFVGVALALSVGRGPRRAAPDLDVRGRVVAAIVRTTARPLAGYHAYVLAMAGITLALHAPFARLDTGSLVIVGGAVAVAVLAAAALLRAWPPLASLIPLLALHAAIAVLAVTSPASVPFIAGLRSISPPELHGITNDLVVIISMTVAAAMALQYVQFQLEAAKLVRDARRTRIWADRGFVAYSLVALALAVALMQIFLPPAVAGMGAARGVFASTLIGASFVWLIVSKSWQDRARELRDIGA